MKRPFVFLKTEWMEFYDGRKGDKAPGKFGYVAQHGEAHEDCNFRQQQGHCYAYAPIAGGGSGINITRLGAPRDADYMNGVDVIFIAAGPDKRGVVVVGWYQNARVYAALQKRGARSYLAECSANDAKRLDVDDRWLRIDDPPRRSNVWYAEGRAKLMRDVAKLMAGDPIVKTAARARVHDAERCLQVEMAAYEAVISHYRKNGYDVTLVWKDKVGWDLEARRQSSALLIEVKGTEQTEIRAELTPNEFTASKERRDYRICIVTAALSRSPEVNIFKANFDRRWFDETGMRELIFEKRTAARLTATHTKAQSK
jgi:hypothetical protein